MDFKSDNKMTINFIGDNSHAILSKNDICDFLIGFPKFAKTKNKKLDIAIKKAQEILGTNLNIPFSESTKSEIDEKEKEDSVKIEIDDNDLNELNLRNKNLIGKKRKKEGNEILQKEKEIIIISQIHFYFTYIYKLINDKKISDLNNEKNFLVKIFDFLINFNSYDINFVIKDTNLYKMIIFFETYFIQINDVKMVEKLKLVKEKFLNLYNLNVNDINNK